MRFVDDDDQAPDPRRADREALQELEAVYRKVDEAQRGLGCAATAECCRFPYGREPYLFPVEWLRLKSALVKQGRAVPPRRADGACPFLSSDDRRCTVYADRPFGCRTFFCERITGGPSPTDAIRELTARLTRVSDRRDPGANPERINALLEQEEAATKRR